MTELLLTSIDFGPYHLISYPLRLLFPYPSYFSLWAPVQELLHERFSKKVGIREWERGPGESWPNRITQISNRSQHMRQLGVHQSGIRSLMPSSTVPLLAHRRASFNHHSNNNIHQFNLGGMGMGKRRNITPEMQGMKSLFDSSPKRNGTISLF